MAADPGEPPHNIDAEKSVLGALLLGGETVGPICQQLRSEDFYRSAHREIYSAILALHGQRAEIDGISVAEELRKRGTLAGSGGESYLVALAEPVSSTASAAWHVNIVRDKAQLRAMWETGTELARKAMEAKAPVRDLVAEFQQAIDGMIKDTVVDDLIDMDQVLAMPDPDWLVAEMLPAGEVCTLIGDTGTYKSLIALRLLLHVQYSLLFAGREVTQGQTLYLDGEGGRGTKLRLRALLQDSQGRPDPRFDRKQYGLPIFRQKPLSLLDAKAVREFVVSVHKRHKRLALVVIDTLSVSIAGRDENAAEVMSAAVEAAKAIRDATGATVLIVHHTGRMEKNRSRGGYPIDCNPAGSLLVERDTDDSVKVTIKKLKDGTVGASDKFRFMRLEVGAHEKTGKMQYGGMVTWEGAVPPPTAEDIAVRELGGQKTINKVLAVLKAAHPGPMTKSDIASEARIRKETCNAILAYLRGKGHTTQNPGPRNSILIGLVTPEVIV